MGVCRRVAGSGGALRLTSALYALALVPALMCDGARLRARLLALGIVIVVAGGVFVLVAEPWYWQVWQHLGNPLFPQFNGLFKSPLAAPVSIADTRWLPRNLGEHLLWPLLFTLKPQRIGDLGLVQALWALLYALVLIVAARAVLRCRVAGLPGLGWTARPLWCWCSWPRPMCCGRPSSASTAIWSCWNCWRRWCCGSVAGMRLRNVPSTRLRG